MKRISLLLFTLFLLLAPAAARAQAVNHNTPVGDFSSLVVQDAIDVVVVVTQDSARVGHASFSATSRVANCLIFSNNGKGRLKIQVAEDLLGNEPTPVVTLYASSLLKVQNDGNDTVSVGPLPALDAFEAVVTNNGTVVIEQVDAKTLTLKCKTGKGTIKASGRCDELKARVLGGGTIDAEQCQATTASCHATGGGSIRVNVEGGELSLKGSGSSKIYYRGNPTNIVKHKIGSMNAIKIED